MNRVNMREARQRLSSIVKAAERGQSVVITRRGRQVARIGPVGPVKGKPLPDLSEFRASVKVKGKPLSAAVVAARREARY